MAEPSTGVAAFRQHWFVAPGPLYRRMEMTVREPAYEDPPRSGGLAYAGGR
jgi:hypothetical protein